MGRKPSAKWFGIADKAERRKAQNRLAQSVKRQRAAENAKGTNTAFRSDLRKATNNGILPEDHASPSRSMDPENESLFNGFQSHYDGDEPLVENSEQLHNNGMETSTIISVGPNFPTTLNWSSGIDFEKSTHSTTPSESWRLETPGPSRSSSTTGNELRLRGWTSPDRLRSNLSYAADNSQQAQPSSENPLSIPARQDSHGYVLDPAITQLSEAPLEQRILHVVESARAAGFDCLDTMILQFYTESFGEDTPLFEIQHRSRRRGLETVLSQLSLQAQTWPQREAQTFEETILASMEQIVKREARDHKAARANADLNPSTPEATSHCTGSLRNQLPITWSILYGTAAAYLSSEVDRSNFVRTALNDLAPSDGSVGGNRCAARDPS